MPIVKGFRRFQSNIGSFRQVVRSSVVGGSNVEESGCGFASKSKRISIAERRELLESFVNKYRGMNSGKFPTPTSAQKQVGGGYYSIKKMLQEMEYNSKLSVEKLPETKKQNKSEDTVDGEMVVKSKSSGSQQVSNSEMSVDQNLYEIEIESVGNLDKNCKGKGKEGLQGSNSLTRDDTHSNRKSDEQLDVKDEDKFGFEGIDSKAEELENDDADGIASSSRETCEDKASSSSLSSSSSSIWGNLKSLASGFINIWKKH